LSDAFERIGRFRGAQFQRTGFIQIFRFNTKRLARRLPLTPLGEAVFPWEGLMGTKHRADVSQSAEGTRAGSPPLSRIIVPRVDVVREGRAVRFLDTCPTLSNAPVQWGGIALENYTVPAVLIPRHEHPEHFLHLVLSGTVKYEVNTRGRNLRFTSRPGTIFLLPQ
jgi:AraC-like ligand binding domain